jgi:hypothetical protein
VGISLVEGRAVIINVTLTYATEPHNAKRTWLHIDASHAYRDSQGRLHTPGHHRRVLVSKPQSITEGLRRGVSVLDDLLRSKGNPFVVPEEADVEEAAWRLAG